MLPNHDDRQPPPALGLREIDQIYACLGVGASLKDAAAYVGVSGAAIRTRRRADPAFARGLRQAVRKGKVHHLNKIAKATAWQASVWFLERRWRRQFGRQAPPDENRLRLLADRSAYDFSSLDMNELRQLCALLNKAARPRGPAATPAEASAGEGGTTSSDTGHDTPDPEGGTDGLTNPAPPPADAGTG